MKTQFHISEGIHRAKKKIKKKIQPAVQKGSYTQDRQKERLTHHNTPVDMHEKGLKQ